MINLFPTPVYTSSLLIEEDFSNIRCYDCGNGHISLSNDVLSHFPQLKQQIDHHIKLYMYELGYSSPVEIVTSWINKHKRNGYCQQHIHSNAIISGVVFIHTPDNSGLFIFKRQQPITHKLFTMQIELKKNSNTQYNTDQFVIKPISKSILLFPSSIPHYVTENETNDERVTLAFNVAPLGTIGDNEQNTVTFRNSTP